MMIRNILISMAVMSASFMINASGSPRADHALSIVKAGIDHVDSENNHSHRFYSVEADNDTTAHGIEYTIDAVKSGEVETIKLCLRNTRHTPFQPLKAGLKLGVDTYMDTYPEWYGKFFPTLAVCEPDHFYGYMQSPDGRMKAVVSADPIASWSLDYNMETV